MVDLENAAIGGGALVRPGAATCLNREKCLISQGFGPNRGAYLLDGTSLVKDGLVGWERWSFSPNDAPAPVIPARRSRVVARAASCPERTSANKPAPQRIEGKQYR
ncbi:hypothetical protein KDL45_06935 [bacterium]|nr:hypothetical protein [bacterium]